MAEAEAKAKPAAEKGPAPKAPLFSKTGILVLLAACAACAGVPTALLMKRPAADPPVVKGRDHSAPHGAGGAFEAPLIPNTVILDPIRMPYRDAGTGAPRRFLTVSVTLAVKTVVDPDLEHPTKDQTAMKAEDDRRKKAVVKRKDWIRDQILQIFRGKGPEDFATNELIEQVRQQIKHAINDELFAKYEVVESVIFTDQGF